MQGVIGAGAAGLVAARELAREGHQPIVFEQGSRPGGVWVYTDDVEEASMPGGGTHAHHTHHCHHTSGEPVSAIPWQPLGLHRCHVSAEHARHAADMASRTIGLEGRALQTDKAPHAAHAGHAYCHARAACFGQSVSTGLCKAEGAWPRVDSSKGRNLGTDCNYEHPFDSQTFCLDPC